MSQGIYVKKCYISAFHGLPQITPVTRIYSDDLEKPRGHKSSYDPRRLIRLQMRRPINVFTGCSGLILSLKCFLNFHIPCSPKLVSFPCSLRRLIWVYTVCTGLSVPILWLYKFLIHASFVCISDRKIFYNLTDIFVFLPKHFSRNNFM